jgi:acyl carrier protein
VLVAPAAAILFIGAPAAAAEGQAITLSLGFDHRILNGVGAAGFLTEIVLRLDHLGRPGGISIDGALAGTRHPGELLRALGSTPASGRRTVLEEHVRGAVAGLLSVPEAHLQMAAPLRNQGLESMHAAELAQMLEHSLGLTVPPTLVWNRPTVRDIAEFLLEQVAVKERNGALGHRASDRAPAGALASTIEGLSDDQVRDLLASLADKSEPDASDRVTS